MRRPSENVTDTELTVLKALWELGPSTIRELTDVLYPGGGPAHYTTVQKLLERLEAKKYVVSDRSNPLVAFAASVSRDDLISRRLQDVAAKLCEGSVTPLLMNLVRVGKLSAGELQA